MNECVLRGKMYSIHSPSSDLISQELNLGRSRTLKNGYANNSHEDAMNEEKITSWVHVLQFFIQVMLLFKLQTLWAVVSISNDLLIGEHSFSMSK